MCSKRTRPCSQEEEEKKEETRSFQPSGPLLFLCHLVLSFLCCFFFFFFFFCVFITPLFSSACLSVVGTISSVCSPTSSLSCLYVVCAHPLFLSPWCCMCLFEWCVSFWSECATLSLLVPTHHCHMIVCVCVCSRFPSPSLSLPPSLKELVKVSLDRSYIVAVSSSSSSSSHHSLSSLHAIHRRRKNE